MPSKKKKVDPAEEEEVEIAETPNPQVEVPTLIGDGDALAAAEATHLDPQPLNNPPALEDPPHPLETPPAPDPMPEPGDKETDPITALLTGASLEGCLTPPDPTKVASGADGDGLVPREGIPPVETVREGYMALAYVTGDGEDDSARDREGVDFPGEERLDPEHPASQAGGRPQEETTQNLESVHQVVADAPGDGAAPKAAQAVSKKAKKDGKPSGAMPPSRADFFAADYRELDRYLSPRQRQEWEAIYASFRSKNLLYGEVIGSDPKTFNMKENGEWVRKKMWCPVLLDYRVKVLIPETEMWMPGEERPSYVLQEMKGAKVGYVIINVDREGECAIASRRIALAAQRHYFATVRGGHQEGEMLKCNVLSVGPKLCLVECGGYDITLTQRDLSYTSIPDLREKYHPGDELDCRLVEYAPKEERLVISVKEVEPNPFIGADQRHPVGARRNATISGKYKGGVFCTLTDGTVVLCLYSPLHSDASFQIGDGAVIVISKFDYGHQLVYGRILSKW